MQWIHSFPSADKRKTCCPYEPPSPEAIRAAAARAGVPADAIIEVSEVRPGTLGTPPFAADRAPQR